MTASTPLEKLAAEACTVYSLPTAAMEVVRLTQSENASAEAIKEAIEADPALTARVLRVVNSSMFGLRSEVSNLQQAIALLGIGPLKVLVLGFSLPVDLLEGVEAEQLQKFWTRSLTRAVAAREIARDWFVPSHRNIVPDDAFTAALLMELGVLVLIQQLGEPYLDFLTQTADAHRGRLKLERQSLGFDRIELTARLLESWKLPLTLVETIRRHGDSDEALAAAVRMANLVAGIVVDEDLEALGPLLGQAKRHCHATPAMVNRLVEDLQHQVSELGEALRVELADGRAYAEVLAEAHAQLALVTQSCIADHPTHDLEDEMGEALLAETQELQLAMRAYLLADKSMQRESTETALTRAEGAHPAKGAGLTAATLTAPADTDRLTDAVTRVAARCRIDRQELCLALVRIEGARLELAAHRSHVTVRNAIAAATDDLNAGRAARITLGPSLIALVMSKVDRRAAVAYCQTVVRIVAEEQQGEFTAYAGVAAVDSVPNRFDAQKLIDAAAGCLTAAAATRGVSVKSIEVY